jgi:hypothetical protein
MATYTEHEQRMLDQQSGIEMDRVAERASRVSGGTHIAEAEREPKIVAEHYAWELFEALKAAVAGAPHWRPEAQALLRKMLS